MEPPMVLLGASMTGLPKRNIIYHSVWVLPKNNLQGTPAFIIGKLNAAKLFRIQNQVFMQNFLQL
jgi:hypothetical protein